MGSGKSAGGRPLRWSLIGVEDDRSPATVRLEGLARLVQGDGACCREVCPAEATLVGLAIRRAVADPAIDAVAISSGQGPTSGVAADAARVFLDRDLPGFGELFRALRFRDAGPRAMLEDAVGGIAGGKPLFCLPGPGEAVALGLQDLVLPVLPDLLAGR